MKEYTNTDKSTWGDGPWQNEPDKIVWVDEATDFDCMIHRNRVGALCGYVGVPKGHPWYGKDYADIEAKVHGDLTYSDSCQEGTPENDGICHAPEAGRSDDIWWFGFDCAHAFDMCPELEARMRGMNVPTIELTGMWRSTYKNRGYVEAQVLSLAKMAQEARDE